MNDNFQWSDPWLLQSILYADKGEGANYVDVVATADGLNHALLTQAEFEGGLARLDGAGLVTARNNRFHATDKARELLQKADTGSNVFDTRDALRDLLAAPDWSPDAETNSGDWPRYPAYSRDAHLAAEAEWQRQANEILHKKS